MMTNTIFSKAGKAAVVLALSGFLMGADSVSNIEELLEEGVYQQEAKGDYAKALELYQEVAKAGLDNRSVEAEAAFRAAVCLMEMGRKGDAITVLEALASDFPDEQMWVDKAKGLMPTKFSPTLVPWKSGERTKFEWKMASGNVLGYSYNTVRDFEWEGRSLWRTEFVALINGQRIVSASEVDSQTFEPVYGQMQQDASGTINWWFRDGAVDLEFAKSGEKKRIQLQELTYDNEQMLMYARQLPVEKDFAITVPLFIGVSGMTLNIDISIESFDTVETELGALDCYCVLFANMMGTSSRWWFTRDERRLPVKMEIGAVTAILVEDKILDSGEALRYEEKEYNASFTMDEQFCVMRDPNEKDPGEFRYFAIAANYNGKIEVFSQRTDRMIGNAQGDLLKGAESLMKRTEKQTQEFELIGEDWERGEKDGNPWLKRQFKYQNGGDEIRESRIFYVADDRFYVLRAKAATSDFSEMHSECERVFASLRTR